MAFWLRGAGASEAEIGQLFQPAPALAAEAPGTARAENHRAEGCEREAEFRELYYSHAGGYDQQWVSEGLRGRLSQVSRGENMKSRPEAGTLVGKNSYIETGTGEPAIARKVLEAIDLAGT
jgi:hypothetical protein